MKPTRTNDTQMVGSTPPASSTRRRVLWIFSALVAINLAVYAPVRQHEFTNYDDPEYVSENPRVAAGLTWDGVWWALTTGHQANWHPLTWLSHMLDVQIYGMNAGPHHFTNLLLHIANTLLLMWLLVRMTGELGRSAFVAALFAVHPLHVESVAWLAERKDVLSTFLGMLTLWAYLEYVRNPRFWRYVAVLLVFALGLMAKPMLVTLPLVLLLLDFWPLGRATFGPGSAGARRPLELLREKVPLIVLAAASSVITFIVQQRGGAVTPLDALPVGARVTNALVSYVAYIGKLFWPTRLAPFYPYSAQMTEWWMPAAVCMIAVSYLAIRMSRRHPYFFVGWFWYVITLLPVIGLVQVGGQSMADRYTYIPLIGLFVALAWGFGHLLDRASLRQVALPAAVFVILLCAIMARAQVQLWKSSMTLWAHALDVTSNNYIAHNNLGHVLDESRVNEAIQHINEAIRLKPDNAVAHNNLGIRLVSLGKWTEAIEHFNEAVRLKPDYALAHNNLGMVLASQGKLSEAIMHYNEALRINPDFPEAHYRLGFALAGLGRVDEAIARYSEALRLKPAYVEALNDLALALAGQGKVNEAIAHFNEALRLKSDYAVGRNNLANVYASQGRIDDAVAEYSHALKLSPSFADAHNNLAIALWKQGKVSEAMAHFYEAVRINPNMVDAHNNLGLALNSLGRADEAIQEFSQVLKINPEHPVARQMLDYLRKRQKASGSGTP